MADEVKYSKVIVTVITEYGAESLVIPSTKEVTIEPIYEDPNFGTYKNNFVHAPRTKGLAVDITLGESDVDGAQYMVFRPHEVQDNDAIAAINVAIRTQDWASRHPIKASQVVKNALDMYELFKALGYKLVKEE